MLRRIFKSNTLRFSLASIVAIGGPLLLQAGLEGEKSDRAACLEAIFQKYSRQESSSLQQNSRQFVHEAGAICKVAVLQIK